MTVAVVSGRGDRRYLRRQRARLPVIRSPLSYRPDHGVTVRGFAVGPTAKQATRLLESGQDLAEELRELAVRRSRRTRSDRGTTVATDGESRGT